MGCVTGSAGWQSVTFLKPPISVRKEQRLTLRRRTPALIATILRIEMIAYQNGMIADDCPNSNSEAAG
jgi:hypothetical protein